MRLLGHVSLPGAYQEKDSMYDRSTSGQQFHAERFILHQTFYLPPENKSALQQTRIKCLQIEKAITRSLNWNGSGYFGYSLRPSHLHNPHDRSEPSCLPQCILKRISVHSVAQVVCLSNSIIHDPQPSEVEPLTPTELANSISALLAKILSKHSQSSDPPPLSRPWRIGE